MSRLLAALTIARRDALRHKARSALIVTMIALPVLGLSAADVLARTMQLSAGEQVTRTIGQADVGLEYVGGHVTQAPNPIDGYDTTGPAAPLASRPQLLRRALSAVGARPGTTMLTSATATLRANGLQASVPVTQVDLTDPLTRGIATVTSGTVPSAASQVAMTSHLLHRLGLHVGSAVAFETADGSGHVMATRTVSGIARSPNGLHDDILYEQPGTSADVDQAIVLAATSHPVTWAAVGAANRLGFVVTSRYVIEHPPPTPPQYQQSSSIGATRIGIATVSIGLAVLEVVLLAGAAFAVGARRQRRDLAVVAAAGGDGRDVARIVLAGGVVLGVVGAATGVVAGIGAAWLALGKTADLTGHAPGPFDVRPLELLVVLAVGLVTGIAASVLPARAAARDDVVGALAGRRPPIRLSRRVPVLGLVMIVAGTLLIGVAARSYHFRLILACAIVVELGFVLCAPTVVALVGRLARVLPLAPRLALRDAARHRGRSGPAVAAVMAAIAGSVAVSGFFVSTDHRNRAEYLPSARIGQSVVSISSHGAAGDRVAASATAVMRRDLGVTSVIDVPTVGCVKVRRGCDDLVEATPFGQGPIAVGDARLLSTLAGSASSPAAAALAAGKVVIFVPSSQTGPPVGSPSWVSQTTDGGSGDAQSLPGARVYADNVGKDGASIAGIMSASTASRLHLAASKDTEHYLLGSGSGVPSQAQEDHAQAQIGPGAGVTVGRPYHAGNDAVGLVALAVAAAIVTLGATAVSVGLSMAESKPDLMTMTAVGGRPLTRRLLVANQAATVAVLGALMGVAAGIVPAWAILRADHSEKFVMPWESILVLVVGLPLLAMAGTAAFAGSRLTVDRRLT